jgi:hypothetical protein
MPCCPISPADLAGAARLLLVRLDFSPHGEAVWAAYAHPAGRILRRIERRPSQARIGRAGDDLFGAQTLVADLSFPRWPDDPPAPYDPPMTIGWPPPRWRVWTPDQSRAFRALVSPQASELDRKWTGAALAAAQTLDRTFARRAQALAALESERAAAERNDDREGPRA